MIQPRIPKILVSVLLGLVLVSCDVNELPVVGLQPTQPPAQSPVVEPLPDTVSAKGVVVPHKKADLSFKVAGRIQQILVSAGDAVVAGQELARLERRDLDQAVLQAQAGLSSAQAELAKAQAGARPEEIAAAEAVVGIAEAGVKAGEGAVEIAKGNLARAQADLESAQSAVDVAQSNQAAAQATLDSAQASLNKLLAGSTQRDIQIAQKQVDLAQNELWGYQRERDEDIPGLEGDIDVAEVTVQIAELQLAQLKDPARVEDVSMARSQVAEAKADVQTAAAQLAQSKTSVTRAQAGVQTAQAQMAQAEADLEGAKAQVDQDQAELDLLRAGTREEDIAVAAAAVSEAEVALADAQSRLDDSILKAPFNGTVGEVLVDEGELVAPEVAIIRVGDLTQLSVETEDLSEVDVHRVMVGQEATLTADALEGETFQGTVSRIAPIATDHRGDTVYTVRIDLGIGPESALRWGMSTFVEIDTQ
jgi:multidrug efflux pump subunit AcrA (membrane-fusion protein)